jgi:hypothetical protein
VETEGVLESKAGLSGIEMTLKPSFPPHFENERESSVFAKP